MAIFKCKMCGGALELNENLSVGACPYCGTTQTFPSVDDERKIALFNRANNLRLKSEFDKAAGIYESIVSEFPDEAEAYWGLVLCKYGIEYVDDPATSKKVPTCHRTVTTSVLDDEDFELAYEYADISAKMLYRDEAKAINDIQKKILEIVATEEPYDIFICYKETDPVTGLRTDDSTIAQDVYTELIKEGYKVFFARVTLRDKAGSEYEPYIYSALSSAKVMLAFGTKFEYFDAVWVKNEWSRYLSMMATDKTKHFIACYKDLVAEDIPKEFRQLQALNINDVTFIKNLFANIEGFITKTTATNVVKQEVVNDSVNGAIYNLLRRISVFLEDGEWQKADEYCDMVLDIDPQNVQAYLGKLMVEFKAKNKASLENCTTLFDSSINYQKILCFGEKTLISELDSYLTVIKGKIENKKKLVPILLNRIATGRNHTIGITADGKIIATKYTKDKNYYRGQCDVSSWSDILAVSACESHTIGLKGDGTVVATGDNDKGQCNVNGWNGIVNVSTGPFHTVGVKANGTVVATGDKAEGKCNVFSWSDIVAVSTGRNHTIGLKSNGTVVATGYNRDGECDVGNWKDIVSISAGTGFSVGLKSDGTVVATGSNFQGQCGVENWKDVIAISAGGYHTVGLKSDGTVIATAFNSESCIIYGGQCDVSNWTDIVAIFAGGSYTVGLKSDGTVVATTYKGDRSNYGGECDVSHWKLFNNINNLEQEQKEAREKRRAKEEKKVAEMRKLAEQKRFREQKLAAQKSAYRSQGLCQYCGGEFKGLFGKKCSKCGKPKDY